MTVAADAIAALRQRLFDMRAELVTQLVDSDVLDAGRLALLADVEIVLGGFGVDKNPAPTCGGSEQSRRRRRGGDHRAEQRVQQRHALRSLAALMGTEAPPEQRARELVSLIGRYQPMPNETSPERLLMRQVIETGLPIPGPDRIARIIRDR